MLPLFEVKKKEEKHHAWSDPVINPHYAADAKLAEKLQAAENLKAFNARYPAAARPVLPPAPIINIPPPIINVPNQAAEIQRLQDRLNRVEKEDREMQERIRNALILDNPRLIRAFYPAANPIFNPSALIDAVILKDLSKKEQMEQTYRKLQDLYGSEAASKLLLRGLNRIEETPVPPKAHKPRAKSPRKKSKSPKRKKSKSPKSKKKGK